MSGLGNKDIFSKNLNRYLELSNKTRNEVCEALDLKYSTFTDWLNGNRYPRIDKIELLANYFNITKSDLIEENTSIEYDTFIIDNDMKIVVTTSTSNTDNTNNIIRLIKYYNSFNKNTKKMAFDYLEHLSRLQHYEDELRAAHNDNSNNSEELDKIHRDFNKF